MDWTLEDNMVDGLFCATLTGRGYTPLVQSEVETSDTGAEDPGSSWEGRSVGVVAGVGAENAESCGAVRPLRIPLLVIRPLRRMYVVVVR